MKILIIIILFIRLFFAEYVNAQSQNHIYYFNHHWRTIGVGYGYNIEKADMNRDGKDDIIVGNYNDTYLYYGGPGIIDTTADVIYKGRCLAILDYNGDGYEDMICMHLSVYDSTRWDYDGEMLYYMGSDTTSILIDTVPDYIYPLPTKYPLEQYFAITQTGRHGVKSGDFNKDGKKDFAVTSTNWPYTPYQPGGKGKIYIYLGKELPVYTPDFELEGKDLRTYLGEYFDVGDINGDDYDDLLFSSIIGTRNLPHTDSLHYLYIFYGSDVPNFILGNEDIKYTSYVRPNIKWAEWFVRYFSVDDINCDGYDDVVIGRGSYLPRVTNVHYGSPTGIDTIPDFVVVDPDSNIGLYTGDISQTIGDYNADGYNDFVAWGGYHTFCLYLGGPYISNENPVGALGFAAPFWNWHFPCKALIVSDQTGDGEVELLVNARSIDSVSYGYAEMVYGNSGVHTDIGEETNIKETGMDLKNNYPNPFNPETVISYQLPVNSFVTLKVYDVLGREIAELLNEEQRPGKYKVNLSGKNLASGVYIVRFSYRQSDGVKVINSLKIELVK